MRFYWIRNSYFAQIEASAVVGLRLGSTCFGVAAPWPPRKLRPWWIPHFTLSLWSHTGQCEQRYIFLVKAGQRACGYLTRGDALPEHWRNEHAGFRCR